MEPIVKQQLRLSELNKKLAKLEARITKEVGSKHWYRLMAEADRLEIRINQVKRKILNLEQGRPENGFDEFNGYQFGNDRVRNEVLSD